MIHPPLKSDGRQPVSFQTFFKNATKKRCSENNCCLRMRGLSNFVILKGESVLPDTKVCDCIIFHDVSIPHLIIVELKRGHVHPSEIKEKFTNTLNWISYTEKQLCSLDDYRVVLLLLHGRGISKSDNASLRAHTFRFKGKRHSLQIMSCHVQLADLYERMTRRGNRPRP